MSKRTDVIRSLFTATPDAAPERKSAPASSGHDERVPALGGDGLSSDNQDAGPVRKASGPVQAIRSTFADIEQENRALRASAEADDRVVTIDAGLIDPSPYPDRFADIDDDAFAQLKQSLADTGQNSPVLLRPHPAVAGRFQTAYGHRRVRALRELGHPVRALIRELSDDDLAAAQGTENAARADLSFIERAVFALRLEAAGRSRAVIRQALAIDKAETSKLIAVASGVPADIIALIGRAPRTGRPRWLMLVEALRLPEALLRVRELASEDHFRSQPSDARFQQVMARAQRTVADAAEQATHRFVLKAASGEQIATVSDAQGQSRILIDRRAHPGFADFVVREIPALFARFADADTQSPGNRKRS